MSTIDPHVLAELERLNGEFAVQLNEALNRTEPLWESACQAIKAAGTAMAYMKLAHPALTGTASARPGDEIGVGE